MADNCTFGITKNILKDCAQPPIAGAEPVAYAMNRADIIPVFSETNPNQLTGLTLASEKYAYKIEGFKKEIDAGFDLVTSETEIDKYNQYFRLQPWQVDAETYRALDGLSDIVVVAERKNKGNSGDGAFIVLGLETGLYKSSDTMRLNSESGKRVIELTNQAGEESTVSLHTIFAGSPTPSYSATKSLLEGLLEPEPIPET